MRKIWKLWTAVIFPWMNFPCWQKIKIQGNRLLCVLKQPERSTGRRSLTDDSVDAFHPSCYTASKQIQKMKSADKTAETFFADRIKQI